MLIPVVIGLVIYSPTFWLTAAVFAVTVVALMEYNGMVFKESGLWPALPLAMLCAFLSFGVFMHGAPFFLPYAFLLAAFFFTLRMFFSRDGFEGATSHVGMRMLGAIYVAMPLAHLVLLREVEDGRWWTLFAFTVVWLNDTCAYYGGKNFGRKKLAPAISPGKTVEGAVCGLAGGIVSAFIFVNVFDMQINPGRVVLFALALGVAGILGDLSESIIKRGAGVKDSGTLIPGHGGMLDRIDSMLFAVPVMYYLALWCL